MPTLSCQRKHFLKNNRRDRDREFREGKMSRYDLPALDGSKTSIQIPWNCVFGLRFNEQSRLLISNRQTKLLSL
jgi:hypothetical protein